MKGFIFIGAAWCVLLAGCRGEVKGTVKATQAQPRGVYSFDKPDAVWELPSGLREISGIAILNDSILVCQEDENAILYLFNLSSKRVDKMITFGKQNDYEDLAIVGNDIYVLQSNGSILQVGAYMQSPVVTKFKTVLTGKNDTEGLCLDPVTGALLITCKGSQDLADTAPGSKMIYSFSLKDKTMSARPTLVFKQPEFAPSALAIHPVSKRVFVLSSKKKKLVELDRNGNQLNLYDLKGKIFMQPEGLAIAANGDIYIANEAGDGPANILLFRFKK